MSADRIHVKCYWEICNALHPIREALENPNDGGSVFCVKKILRYHRGTKLSCYVYFLKAMTNTFQLPGGSNTSYLWKLYIFVDKLFYFVNKNLAKLLVCGKKITNIRWTSGLMLLLVRALAVGVGDNIEKNYRQPINRHFSNYR